MYRKRQVIKYMYSEHSLASMLLCNHRMGQWSPGTKCFNWVRFGWATLPPLFFYVIYIYIYIGYISIYIYTSKCISYIYKNYRIHTHIYIYTYTHIRSTFLLVCCFVTTAWNNDDQARSASTEYASVEPPCHHYFLTQYTHTYIYI